MSKPRIAVKMSLYEDKDQQRRINECTHAWVDKRGLIFKYIKVDQQCDHCGTWRRVKPKRRVPLLEQCALVLVVVAAFFAGLWKLVRRR